MSVPKMGLGSFSVDDAGKDHGCREGASDEHSAALAEADRVMAMTDEEIMVEAVREFGSEEAVHAEAERLRAKMLATVDAHAAGQVPTADPAVMRDYIIKLTSFFIDNPKWTALAEEARGYIGALAEKGE